MQLGIYIQGKSTLLDLLLCLRLPTTGSICVDGSDLSLVDESQLALSWMKQISHVPQEVYLTDNDLASNIALGRSEADIDMSLVASVAEKAGLSDLIASLPDAYSTNVGERGCRLSGGQRQRIGIARALYNRCSVLILDEPTSSLDPQSEKAIVGTLSRIDSSTTIILVTHNSFTSSVAERQVVIERGRVVADISNLV